MKKRIYFKKFDEMKYISHLDFVKFLERLFKISGITLIYSNGFSPKPKFSFGNPISIGEEAVYEPFDADIRDLISNEALVNKINMKAPKGFEILNIEDISPNDIISKKFNGIEYEIKFANKEKFEIFINFINQDKMLDKKEKNGKIVIRDLSKKILSLIQERDTIRMVLENVSPNAYFRLANIRADEVSIKRLRYVNIKEEEC